MAKHPLLREKTPPHTHKTKKAMLATPVSIRSTLETQHCQMGDAVPIQSLSEMLQSPAEPWAKALLYCPVTSERLTKFFFHAVGKQTRTVAIVTQALSAKPEFEPTVCVLTAGQSCPFKVASNTNDKESLEFRKRDWAVPTPRKTPPSGHQKATF